MSGLTSEEREQLDAAFEQVLIALMAEMTNKAHHILYDAVEVIIAKRDARCICEHDHPTYPVDVECPVHGLATAELADRLADAEARAETAKAEVEEAIAEFEVLAAKMRPSIPTWDHAPISGYVISADDWRSIRARLRQALRGES